MITARAALGIALAVLVVVLLAPSDRLPWSRLVHTWGSGLAAPACASLMLVLAAWLLPRPTFAPTPRRDGVALALGFLLILEPVMHLAALWWSAQGPSPAVSEVIFPIASGRPATSLQWLMWFEVLVMAPIAEEWFFRGRLLPWLNERLGRMSGISITTLAFAVAHLQPMQAVLAVPLGLLLAWLRLRGGGVSGCIVAHSAHNLLFLALGPALIGLPTMASIMVVGGLVIVALAWLHLGGSASRWRPLMAMALVLVGTALVMLVQPWHRQVQDRWWVQAAHQLLVYWRIDNDELLARVDGRLRTGALNQARREALAAVVGTSPCQTWARQHVVLATLDPLGFANAVAEWDAQSVLEDLGFARGSAERDRAVMVLGLRHPGAFARVVSGDPHLLRRWLPLPGMKGSAATQLAATAEPMHRRALLGVWERTFPGQVADVLLLLPPESVTMNDRRHLWVHYPDAQQRIETVRRTDPRRAAAFGPGWDGAVE